MEKDFNKWLSGKPNWKEISFQYNTKKAYQKKQDLVAVFWNSYIYFQQKFELYFEKFQAIPIDVFNNLIFEFRQNFPKTGRIKGINYYDDLIEQLIEKHKTLSSTQGIEDLTKEKLEEYGFDAENINRLFTWEKYECFLQNNRGYFWASNIEKKIYSGVEGREKHFEKSMLPEHHKEPKEKFKTFNELFRYALSASSITIPESVLGKDFEYRNAESSHNFSFNVWLQNYKGWEYGNEEMYIERLTRENWVAYLTHCDNEKKELKRKAEKIKEQWQPKALPPQETKPEQEQETEAENNLLLSTIEDWLFPFKEENILSEIDYEKLVLAYKQYFETGIFPAIYKQIRVGKVNKKRFGWALNEIFRANKTNNETLPTEYLQFAKQNISIFSNVDFNEANILNSNLYKYFTTKTQ